MKWLGRKLGQLSQYLIAYGAFGLFAIALIDSALVPLPGGPDAVMMLLSWQQPAWMPLYAAAATLGSVAGCLILHSISRRAGRRALARFSPARQARVQDLMARYDALALLVASILPPPFPFKLFVIMAGVLRMNRLRFAIAVGIGRAFRFLLEGYLAVRYGERAAELLAQYYPIIGIALAGLIIIIFIARNLLRRRAEDAAVSEMPSSSYGNSSQRRGEE